MDTAKTQPTKTSSFERLSRAVRLRDICRTCGDVWDLERPDAMTVGEAMKKLLGAEYDRNDFSRPILLRTRFGLEDGYDLLGGTFPYGVFFPDRALEHAISFTEGDELYIDYDLLKDEWLDAGRGISVAEFAESSLVSGESTMWDLLTELSLDLGQRDAMLVLLGTMRYGIVTLEEIIGSPDAKACWLALALDLERNALEACRRNPKAALRALPVDRRRAALGRLKERESAVAQSRREEFQLERGSRAMAAAFSQRMPGGECAAAQVLEYTMLADKKTMLCNFASDFGLSKTKLKEVFEGAQKLRDWAAHPTSVPEIAVTSLGELRVLINKILELTAQLENRSGPSRQ